MRRQQSFFSLSQVCLDYGSQCSYHDCVFNLDLYFTNLVGFCFCFLFFVFSSFPDRCQGVRGEGGPLRRLQEETGEFGAGLQVWASGTEDRFLPAHFQHTLLSKTVVRVAQSPQESESGTLGVISIVCVHTHTHSHSSAFSQPNYTVLKRHSVMYNFSGKINTMCKMAKFHQWTRQLTSAVDKTPTPPAPVCPLQPLRERQPLYSEQDSYHPVCPLYISNICERDNLSTVDKTPIPPVCLLYISNL